jgi:hypothetical protein
MVNMYIGTQHIGAEQMVRNALVLNNRSSDRWSSTPWCSTAITDAPNLELRDCVPFSRETGIIGSNWFLWRWYWCSIHWWSMHWCWGHFCSNTSAQSVEAQAIGAQHMVVWLAPWSSAHSCSNVLKGLVLSIRWCSNHWCSTHGGVVGSLGLGTLVLQCLCLKGLSHEIFGPVYWPVWIHIGLNKNRFWFLNFKEAPSIWGSHFKFLCVSVQTFSEILRISEKDSQLSQRFSNFRRFLVSGSPRNLA